MYSTMTSESFNKLEIYDTGDKSLCEMRRLTASIFDVDPDQLGLMRVDLCVDVHGVDVGWFKRHTIAWRLDFVGVKIIRSPKGKGSPMAARLQMHGCELSQTEYLTGSLSAESTGKLGYPVKTVTMSSA